MFDPSLDGDCLWILLHVVVVGKSIPGPVWMSITLTDSAREFNMVDSSIDLCYGIYYIGHLSFLTQV